MCGQAPGVVLKIIFLLNVYLVVCNIRNEIQQ